MAQALEIKADLEAHGVHVRIEERWLTRSDVR